MPYMHHLLSRTLSGFELQSLLANITSRDAQSASVGAPAWVDNTDFPFSSDLFRFAFLFTGIPRFVPISSEQIRETPFCRPLLQVPDSVNQKIREGCGCFWDVPKGLCHTKNIVLRYGHSNSLRRKV